MQSNLIIIVLTFVFALAITAFGIPKVIKMAVLKRLYDLPGERTSHNRPTPRLGGAMIFAGVIIASVLFTHDENNFQIKYVIAGMLILFFIGIKDDIISLSPFKKILGQLFATMILVIPGNVRIIDSHNIFGLETFPPFFSIIISVFFVLSMINCINLIDGIDGLASGIGIIASASFGYVFYISGQFSYAVICGSLLGSLFAFTWYNVFSVKHKIFLGDTGSMLIGFLLSLFAIRFLELNSDKSCVVKITASPAITLSILCIPIFDTFRVVIIRLLKRKPLFQADRNHLHHKVLSASKSHLQTTGIMLLANICIIALTFTFRSLGNPILITSLVILWGVILTVFRWYLKRSNLN